MIECQNDVGGKNTLCFGSRAIYFTDNDANRPLVLIPLLQTRCFQGEKVIYKELFNLFEV